MYRHYADSRMDASLPPPPPPPARFQRDRGAPRRRSWLDPPPKTDAELLMDAARDERARSRQLRHDAERREDQRVSALARSRLAEERRLGVGYAARRMLTSSSRAISSRGLLAGTMISHSSGSDMLIPQTTSTTNPRRRRRRNNSARVECDLAVLTSAAVATVLHEEEAQAVAAAAADEAKVKERRRARHATAMVKVAHAAFRLAEAAEEFEMMAQSSEDAWLDTGTDVAEEAQAVAHEAAQEAKAAAKSCAVLCEAVEGKDALDDREIVGLLYLFGVDKQGKYDMSKLHDDVHGDDVIDDKVHAELKKMAAAQGTGLITVAEVVAFADGKRGEVMSGEDEVGDKDKGEEIRARIKEVMSRQQEGHAAMAAALSINDEAEASSPPTLPTPEEDAHGASAEETLPRPTIMWYELPGSSEYEEHRVVEESLARSALGISNDALQKQQQKQQMRIDRITTAEEAARAQIEAETTTRRRKIEERRVADAARHHLGFNLTRRSATSQSNSSSSSSSNKSSNSRSNGRAYGSNAGAEPQLRGTSVFDGKGRHRRLGMPAVARANARAELESRDESIDWAAISRGFRHFNVKQKPANGTGSASTQLTRIGDRAASFQLGEQQQQQQQLDVARAAAIAIADAHHADDMDLLWHEEHAEFITDATTDHFNGDEASAGSTGADGPRGGGQTKAGTDGTEMETRLKRSARAIETLEVLMAARQRVADRVAERQDYEAFSYEADVKELEAEMATTVAVLVPRIRSRLPKVVKLSAASVEEEHRVHRKNCAQIDAEMLETIELLLSQERSRRAIHRALYIEHGRHAQRCGELTGVAELRRGDTAAAAANRLRLLHVRAVGEEEAEHERRKAGLIDAVCDVTQAVARHPDVGRLRKKAKREDLRHRRMMLLLAEGHSAAQPLLSHAHVKRILEQMATVWAAHVEHRALLVAEAKELTAAFTHVGRPGEKKKLVTLLTGADKLPLR